MLQKICENVGVDFLTENTIKYDVTFSVILCKYCEQEEKFIFFSRRDVIESSSRTKHITAEFFENSDWKSGLKSS